MAAVEVGAHRARGFRTYVVEMDQRGTGRIYAIGLVLGQGRSHETWHFSLQAIDKLGGQISGLQVERRSTGNGGGISKLVECRIRLIPSPP